MMAYFFQDPREYLPFLRELRAFDPHYQRFRIDDHLKRHEKALRSLSEAGMVKRITEGAIADVPQGQSGLRRLCLTWKDINSMIQRSLYGHPLISTR